MVKTFFFGFFKSSVKTRTQHTWFSHKVSTEHFHFGILGSRLNLALAFTWSKLVILGKMFALGLLYSNHTYKPISSKPMLYHLYTYNLHRYHLPLSFLSLSFSIFNAKGDWNVDIILYLFSVAPLLHHEIVSKLMTDKDPCPKIKLHKTPWRKAWSRLSSFFSL